MKALKQIKLSLVSIIMIITLGACLDTKDPDYGFSYLMGYIEQVNDVSDTSFRPVFRIIANESTKEATVTLGERQIMLTAVDTEHKIFDAKNSLGLDWSDTIPNGRYEIAITSYEEEFETYPMTLHSEKQLGGLNVTKFEYSKENGLIAEWEKTTNATSYTIGFRTPGMKVWLWETEYDAYKTSASIPAGYFAEGEMEVTVGALCGNLITTGPILKINWGQ